MCSSRCQCWFYVSVRVGVSVGICIDDSIGDCVGVCDGVAAGISDCVSVGVSIGVVVDDGLSVRVCVSDGVGISDCVSVGVSTGVVVDDSLSVSVRVCVSDGVGSGDCVDVGVVMVLVSLIVLAKMLVSVRSLCFTFEKSLFVTHENCILNQFNFRYQRMYHQDPMFSERKMQEHSWLIPMLLQERIFWEWKTLCW